MPDSSPSSDLSPDLPPDLPAAPALSDLMAEAAALEGGTLADVTGSERTQASVRPRHAAMWLAYKLKPSTLTELGRAFRRHHTTVLYGVRAYERRLARDAEANARGHALLARLYEEERAAADLAEARRAEAQLVEEHGNEPARPEGERP